MSLTILLVEDPLDIDGSLASGLSEYGHEISCAPDSRQAFSAVARVPFDIMILDWSPPKIDGIEILRQLRDNDLSLPVMMVTALGRTFDKVEALNAGADDYLVKPVDMPELDARLRALVRARQMAATGQDTIRAGEIVVSPSRLRATRNGQPIDLSRTEFNLLLTLVRNAGAITTKSTLLEQVWGQAFTPNTNIVEANIRRLRLKLAQHGDDPISNVRGVGYQIRT